MKKKLFLVVAFVTGCFALFAQTQTVKLINIAQLEKRISNPDTVYVVNFWATWCGPCVAELPNFEKLQKVYAGKALKVLLISMDFKSKLNNEVIPFVKKQQLSTEVFLADKTSEQEFIDKVDKDWSGALPGTLLINNKKHFRKFYEREFIYDELNQIYQKNK